MSLLPWAMLAGVALLATPYPVAAEVCRYAGTTSHAGRVAAMAEVTGAADAITVGVTLDVTVSAWMSEVRYLAQEISAWRGNELQSVAVNNRTIVDGRASRQQWDVFAREPGGLEARRVQARTLADFQRRHPGFVRHWALADFGQPWLQDYAAASAERRPDLDLPSPALPSGLRTPLALAFYWSRWLPPEGGMAPVFLPGFKRDARIDLAFGPAAAGDGWRRWQAPLRHPGLTGGAPSMAAAWVSPDGHLQQLAFDVHARLGSGQGLIRAQGCQGVQIAPSSPPR